jgi:hypothetical protein
MDISEDPESTLATELPQWGVAAAVKAYDARIESVRVKIVVAHEARYLAACWGTHQKGAALARPVASPTQLAQQPPPKKKRNSKGLHWCIVRD